MSSSKSRIPLVDFAADYHQIEGQVKTAVNEVLDSGRYILGENVRQLEEQIARKIRSKHAIGVASGSDALLLALLALGIGPGDEVITTPFTFFATAGAVSRTGARVVFADIDPQTYNLNAADIAGKITDKTKAIIPVHLFGYPADMDAIMAVAREHSVAVIEDAAQSFGAVYRGKFTGAIGDIGCFSFYPTKNLGGGGDGGMVTTSSDELAQKVRLLRQHGSRQKYLHEIVGINSRLDEIQAAILRVKLGWVDSWNQKRRQAASEYDRLLSGIQGLMLPPSADRDPPVTPIYHLYSVMTKRRDAFVDALTEQGIGTGIYYPVALHLQKCYADLGYRVGDLPVAEKACQEIVSLPMYPGLTGEAVARVAQVVRAFFAG